jgi:hypothetical protein
MRLTHDEMRRTLGGNVKSYSVARGRHYALKGTTSPILWSQWVGGGGRRKETKDAAAKTKDSRIFKVTRLICIWRFQFSFILSYLIVKYLRYGNTTERIESDREGQKDSSGQKNKIFRNNWQEPLSRMSQDFDARSMNFQSDFRRHPRRPRTETANFGAD